MHGPISAIALNLIAYVLLASSVASLGPALPTRPSYIQLENISQKYPVTLMQKLFSSVPKREYAVHNINLSFGHVPFSSTSQNGTNFGVTIIDGRSASGKSTILRLLAGLDSPAEGRLFINGNEVKVEDAPRRDIPSWMKVGSSFASSSIQTGGLVQPVIIEGKPDFVSSKTVLERMYHMGRDAVQHNFKKQDLEGKYDDERDRLLQKLALEFAKLLQLTEEQYSGSPSDLSPSGQFLFGIACACMVSVAPSVTVLDLNDSTNIQSISLPCPILLFDELFDSEHSTTLDKCKAGITNLIQSGGVVVSVTHRPLYFMNMASRRITMSGGKVLADIKIDNVENQSKTRN